MAAPNSFPPPEGVKKGGNFVFSLNPPRGQRSPRFSHPGTFSARNNVVFRAKQIGESVQRSIRRGADLPRTKVAGKLPADFEMGRKAVKDRCAKAIEAPYRFSRCLRAGVTETYFDDPPRLGRWCRRRFLPSSRPRISSSGVGVGVGDAGGVKVSGGLQAVGRVDLFCFMISSISALLIKIGPFPGFGFDFIYVGPCCSSVEK